MIIQDELDSLPINEPCFGQEMKVINGRTIAVPVVISGGLALFHTDDDPLLIHDREGRAWSVGWANGKRYKQRVSP